MQPLTFSVGWRQSLIWQRSTALCINHRSVSQSKDVSRLPASSRASCQWREPNECRHLGDPVVKETRRLYRDRLSHSARIYKNVRTVVRKVIILLWTMSPFRRSPLCNWDRVFPSLSKGRYRTKMQNIDCLDTLKFGQVIHFVWGSLQFWNKRKHFARTSTTKHRV